MEMYTQSVGERNNIIYGKRETQGNETPTKTTKAPSDMFEMTQVENMNYLMNVNNDGIHKVDIKSKKYLSNSTERKMKYNLRDKQNSKKRGFDIVDTGKEFDSHDHITSFTESPYSTSTDDLLESYLNQTSVVYKMNQNGRKVKSSREDSQELSKQLEYSRNGSIQLNDNNNSRNLPQETRMDQSPDTNNLWNSISRRFQGVSNSRNNSERYPFEEIIDEDEIFEDNPLIYYLRKVQLLHAIFLILNGFGVLLLMFRIFHSHLSIFQNTIIHNYGVILIPIWFADLLAFSLLLVWLLQLRKLKRFSTEERRTMSVSERMKNISYEMLPMKIEIFVYIFNYLILVVFLLVSEILFIAQIENGFPSVAKCLFPIILYCIGGMLNVIIFKRYNFWTFAAYFYVLLFLWIIAIKSKIPVKVIDERETTSNHSDSHLGFFWALLYLPTIIEKGVQELPWSFLMTPLWLLLLQSFGYVLFLKYHIYRSKRIEATERQKLILILYFVSLLFCLLGALLIASPELSDKIFHMKHSLYESWSIKSSDKYATFSLDPLPWILFYSSLLTYFGASYILLEEWSETLQETEGYVEPLTLNQTNEGWIPVEKEIKHYILLGAVIVDKRSNSRSSSSVYSQRII